ncbi:hypothetical protein [Ornithinibacillus sp. JPR2-1]|uniref:hypothetical protein n=1 Tax=Ornithinibacillus sp. JPR2-1 TaxID=2094019 RepID=UPI0031D44182
MITDEFGGAFNYEKVNTFEVDSQGIGIEDGKDYWNYIVSAGDEEKVIFQVTDDFETSKIYVFKFKE